MEFFYELNANESNFYSRFHYFVTENFMKYMAENERRFLYRFESQVSYRQLRLLRPYFEISSPASTSTYIFFIWIMHDGNLTCCEIKFCRYYGSNSVCIPQLFAQTGLQSSPFSIFVTLFNFLAFVFVALAYFVIIVKAKKKRLRSPQSVIHHARVEKRTTGNF